VTDIDGTDARPASDRPASDLPASELPAELARWPAVTLDDERLGELELITSGAFAPVDGYLTSLDLASVEAEGTLADGTPWPVPVTLTVLASALPADASRLVLQDGEGSPLAVLSITEAVPDGDSVRLAGPVIALRAPEHGPFRGLRQPPAAVRAALAGSSAVLAYPTRGPLHRRQIGQLRHYATQLNARLLILPLITGPVPVVRRPEALVRAVLAAARQLPAGTQVVPVPLPRYADTDADLRAAGIVAAAYGGTHLLVDSSVPAGPNGRNGRNGPVTLPGVPIPVVLEPEWGYDPRSEVWRPLSLIEPGAERTELSADEVISLLDSGGPLPEWFTPGEVAAELRRVRPPRSERGLVVFFTGLSGAGKSTIARGLAEAITERGDRTVSLLDGDHVRQLLSAGLSFSRADRDLNIARIGFVAAEIARHGGIAVCAPIAPYAAARAAVRETVAETGDFLLVYVSTPVDVCAERDRKGLYAKARAGLLDGFTGVSDPYEEPRDADLVLDTSAMSRDEAIGSVLRLLTSGGWLLLA
jgi:sulfate adenylyltransferase